MALKKEVQVKIDGDYVRGSIINGKFRTSNLITLEQRYVNNGISGPILEKIIEELIELKESIDANQISEVLATSEKPNINDIDDIFF